ncbi:DNA polymerase III subunit gamma/tau [Corynebacterium sp. HMSC072B09]|uniref:DNA polymerase III subunit gamma and tau n=1 Tax=unclassified Corynebacterium TaxID=2624378 RepID=UPI0008A9E28F|nr:MULTISPECIES: DNA polymerase III subunit gamma and tau [unclassified Corynebacterium]OHR30408.1 DNA polymerase III subunit gamma/tau [Corynebacterium sp. HMSC073B01]OHR30531.1 DNA polymerase III subunit gamma/tau [Corynebacterium sp. HMSC072B09]
MALYRKYRPASFAEVVGQRHVTDPLSAALESRDAQGRPNRINHAYLFSGPRGCGKTSSARIMARSLNCAEGPTATPCGQCASCRALAPGGPGNLDVIELDAASHNGVEDMRELREKAIFQPAESRYRIFIIDEAHMITASGFNALLKIVEEPPEHLIFIFATTEPERVLPTIRSRTHHYPFRLLTPPDMRGLLERVVTAEGVRVEPDVYPLVIQAGGGSPRDSLSVMDQLIAGSGTNGVDYETSAAILGVTDSVIITDAIEALAAGDRAAMFSVVGRVIMSGQDPARFASDLLGRVRDLLVLSAVPNALEQGLVEIPESQIDGVLEQAGTIPPATLTRFTQVLSDGLRHFRGVTSPRLLLEVLCARMLLPATEDSVESLLQRVEALEHGRPALADGSGAATPAAAPVSSDAGAAEASPMQSGQSAREAWRQRNAQRKKGAQSASVTQRGRTEQAAPAQAPSQPQPQPGPQPKVQSEPVEQQSAPAAAVSQESVTEPKPAPEAPTAPAEQPEQPTQATPAESVEQPQQAEQPQQPESAEQPLSEEEAQAEKIREFRRKMAEHARISEQQTRAQLAQEREQQTREREGEGGSMSIVEEEPVVSSSPTHSEQQTQPTQAAQSEQPAQPEQSAESARPTQAAQPEQPEQPTQTTQSPESQPEPQVQQAPEPAPQPEPTPQPEPEPAPAGIEQIRERWQDILAAVDGPHAFPIRVLAEQAVPLDVENDRLIIGHSTGALATRLNTPDYEQALSAAVKQVTGFNGQVHCVVGTRPRAPRSTATGGVAGEDDSSSRGSSSPNDTAPAPTPAAPAQPETSEQQVQQEQQTQPEPASRPQRSSAYASVAERRAKIEAAKRAAMGHQAGHDQPAQPHQQSQPSQPTQPNPNPVHQQPQQQPNQPQPQSFLRAAQANAQANAHAQANQDSGFGGVPLPPEPMEEFAPPEGAEGAGGYGSRTPSNANTNYNPVPQTPQDNNYEEDTSEYFEAANEVGSLDHRSLKDVVMEMLEKELGAKPLEDR